MSSERAAALRLVGAGVGVIIAAAIAIIPSVAWQFDALGAGVPSVLVLGYWLGPRAVDHPATAAVVLMIGAVVLSALVVATVASTGGEGELLSLLAVTAIGIAIFGLPALLVTGPAAVAWLLVVRWVARHEPTDRGPASGRELHDALDRCEQRHTRVHLDLTGGDGHLAVGRRGDRVHELLAVECGRALPRERPRKDSREVGGADRVHERGQHRLGDGRGLPEVPLHGAVGRDRDDGFALAFAAVPAAVLDRDEGDLPRAGRGRGRERRRRRERGRRREG